MATDSDKSYAELRPPWCGKAHRDRQRNYIIKKTQVWWEQLRYGVHFFWVIRLSTGKTCIRKTATVNRKGLEAPYMTSCRVAKTGKPPTVVNSSCFRDYDWDNAGKKAKKTYTDHTFIKHCSTTHPWHTHTHTTSHTSQWILCSSAGWVNRHSQALNYWCSLNYWWTELLIFFFFFFLLTWMKLIMDYKGSTWPDKNETTIKKLKFWSNNNKTQVVVAWWTQSVSNTAWQRTWVACKLVNGNAFIKPLF